MGLAVLLAWTLPAIVASAGPGWKKVNAVPLELARHEVPEHQLLHVGIQVLDHGLPEDDEVRFALEDLRKSEARYIPVRLRDTLRITGFWGAVRVVPGGMDSSDLTVSGKIKVSNGKRLILDVSAVDATGLVWLDKQYKQLVDSWAYYDMGDGIFRQPFQNFYNRIANDLAAVRRKMKDPALTNIRRVSQLKFAADLAPAAFGDHLGTDRKGRTIVARLPAADDPMMARVHEIRKRDDMLVDTLTEHYTSFAVQMDETYLDWRRFSYEEVHAFDRARRQARTSRVLGAVAILGGGLSDATLFGGAMTGAMALRSGNALSKQAKMHAEALRELTVSFDAAMEPLVIEVENRTLRLTGSAEVRYEAWRELLQEIFASETGLPVKGDGVNPE